MSVGTSYLINKTVTIVFESYEAGHHLGLTIVLLSGESSRLHLDFPTLINSSLDHLLVELPILLLVSASVLQL